MREKEDIKLRKFMRYFSKVMEWRKKCEFGVERSDFYMYEFEEDFIFNLEVLFFF